MGKVSIVLVEAKNLMPPRLTARVDAYVLVRLRSGGPTFRSVLRKSLNGCPVWQQEMPTLFFHNAMVNVDAIVAEVWDAGIIQDEPLGLVEVPLGCVSSLFGEPQWLHLQGGHGAQIRLLAFFKQDEPEPPVPPLAALPSFSVEYEVHSAALAGIATTQFGQSYRSFKCWKVVMPLVSEVFHDVKHHWNEQYDKARQIFSSPIQGPIIRSFFSTCFDFIYSAAIHVQHATLYKEATAEKGVMRTAMDFFKLINFGIRDRSPTIFTYVILDDQFKFSETGASFTKDFMSKHAMHANASEEVRYAGEFFVMSHGDGTYRLIIDNCSGTYGPLQVHLRLLEELFNRSFPGILVSALHFEDPLVIEQKATIRKQQQEDWRIT